MFTATLITSLLAATAFARPNALRKRDNTCLTYDQAYKVAETWGSLIANYSTAVAELALVENFTDYSESVNSLINNCPQGDAAVALPLEDPTFTTRAAFELGQGQQPPINFNLLQVFPGCGSVSFRWKTTNTAPIPNPRPIIGLIVIETVPNPNKDSEYEFLISTVYSEFDSGDWLQNLKDAGICATTSSSCATASPTSPASSAPTSAGEAVSPAGYATASAAAPPAYKTTGVTQAAAAAAYTTAAPAIPVSTGAIDKCTTTSTDQAGNVWIKVTETSHVYATMTEYVTVTKTA